MIETKCLLCDELVYASPKPETWGIQWGRGWVHFKCAQKLFEAVRAVQEADELDMGQDEKIDPDDPIYHVGG